MNAGWALLAAGLLFVLFMVFKTRWPFWDTAGRETRARFVAAKQRSREADDPRDRARALREAAHAALEDLARPNLAASYARRADRADPDSPEGVGLLAIALRRAARYRALERQLWRKLASGRGQAAYDRAFDELLSLYDGPMRRPEQAEVLRRLREGSRRADG